MSGCPGGPGEGSVVNGMITHGGRLDERDDLQVKFARGNASHTAGYLALTWTVWELLRRMNCP